MVKTSIHLSLISGGIAVLAFTCQMLIARAFGALHAFDVYLIAISIPFLVTGAAAGAVSQAFVPRLIATRSDPAAYQQSVSALLTLAVVGAVVIALGGYAVTLMESSALGAVLTASDRAVIAAIARIAWLSSGVAVLASALTAVHHSEKSFILPAITNSGLYLGMIITMLVLPVSRGPVLLAWGMLAGSLAAVLVLLPMVLRRTSIRRLGKIRFGPLFEGTRLVILVVLANCGFSGLAPIEAILAPNYGPGALSYLAYSQRLIIAMGALVVAGPNVLLLPAISEASVANELDRAATLAARTIAGVFAIASLAALFFYFLRLPLIKLFLERGAFDAATTRGVASTLPWMLLGAIAMLASQPVYRVLYGQNRHHLPAFVGLLIPTLYFILGTLFGKTFGFQGVCLAYASAWWLGLLLLLCAVFASHPRRVADLAPGVAPFVSALVAAAAALWIGKMILLPQTFLLGSLDLAWRCGTVSAIGLCCFTLMTVFIWPVPALRGLFLKRCHVFRRAGAAFGRLP